jgi:hypothetical protein
MRSTISSISVSRRSPPLDDLRLERPVPVARTDELHLPGGFG